MAGLYTFVAVVDIVRLHAPGTAPLGYLTLVAWVIPGMFGVADRRWLLTPRAGVAIVLCALAIAAAPRIARWARRPRVWWLTAIGNSGAMTLCLWHMPALLGVHLVFDYLGYSRCPAGRTGCC